jgi:hypothetical protein
MSPDIFNNSRLGFCGYEGFSKIFEDQNERDQKIKQSIAISKKRKRARLNSGSSNQSKKRL